MTTHSSVFAWRIPGTGEPGGLPSMGSHRVRHDWSDLAAAAAANLYWTQRNYFGHRKSTYQAFSKKNSWKNSQNILILILSFLFFPRFIEV